MTDKEEKPLHSLIAGTIAGGVEAYVGNLVEIASLNVFSKFFDLSN